MILEYLDYAKDYLFGNFFNVITVGAAILAVIFFVALHIYHSLAWFEIGKRQKYGHSWLAWIPFANISMILQMGKFHWAWIFLILIPIAGWIALLVLLVISMWRIFEKDRYPGWFSISLVIPQIGGILYLIIIGIIAWKEGPKKKSSLAPVKKKSIKKKKRK
ncbi:hypothetical protein COU58_00630 [Candidatus Pacearchaeota archaeon CG10_big_fil_rev_8_21_14_0_10_32_42]|nr:MAG: hypothetical protein COU58_00630 [Candidatus Pacearchaeota archaeon CG10_big_fil_rev_8_21_14_0_10_32_42]